MDLNPQALMAVVERIAASGQKEPVALLVRAQRIRRWLHKGPPRRGTEARRMPIWGIRPPSQEGHSRSRGSRSSSVRTDNVVHRARGDRPPAQMLQELRC